MGGWVDGVTGWPTIVRWGNEAKRVVGDGGRRDA